MASGRAEVHIEQAQWRWAWLSATGPIGHPTRQEANEVQTEAQSAAPVDTGALRDSIVVQQDEDKDEVGPAFWIGPTALDPQTGFPYPGVQEARLGYLKRATQ